MAAHDSLGSQFDMRDIPAPFGTTPIPEGHVRFNHYTRSLDNVPSIRQHGILASKAAESFARGGTESPQTFATAGAPTDDFMRSHVVVEGHVDPHDLDVGNRTDPATLEARRSTITTWKDISPANIVGIHEPWHQTFRYIQDDPSMEAGVMHGDYDSGHGGDPQTQKALSATKVALAGKVMLGGKLEGKHL